MWDLYHRNHMGWNVWATYPTKEQAEAVGQEMFADGEWYVRKRDM